MIISMLLGRHEYDSKIPWFNSVSESFDSTQVMTHNDLTRIDSNHLTTQNGFLKFDSNKLTTQKTSEYFSSNQLTTQLSGILIQSDLWLTNTIWNIGLNQVMTQWFKSTADFVDLFWAFAQFRLTFFGTSLNFVDLFGLSLNFVDLFWSIRRQLAWIESAHDSTSISKTWIDSTQTQGAFQELTQNQVMTQVDYPGIGSDWLMTQGASHFLIQINSWLKRKAFDSDSTLIHIHVCC